MEFYKKWWFWTIVIALMIIIFMIIIPKVPNVNKDSTKEEICNAIKTDFLKNQCLAYINDNPSFCDYDECYNIMAFKLGKVSICSKSRDAFCPKLANLSEIQKQEIFDFYEKDLSSCEVHSQNIIEVLDNNTLYKGGDTYTCSNNPKDCDLNNKECYGTCDVARTGCIIKVASILKNKEICNYIKENFSGKERCILILAIATKDLELCKKLRTYYRDECFLNYATDRTHHIFDPNIFRNL
jgi:hypothetical protein